MVMPQGRTFRPVDSGYLLVGTLNTGLVLFFIVIDDVHTYVHVQRKCKGLKFVSEWKQTECKQ